MAPILGQKDEFLDLVAAGFPDDEIFVRGDQIRIEGPNSDAVGELFEDLAALAGAGQTIDESLVNRSIDMVLSDVSPSEVLSTEILARGRSSSVRPKTAGQKKYVDAIASNIITFGIGPRRYRKELAGSRDGC